MLEILLHSRSVRFIQLWLRSVNGHPFSRAYLKQCRCPYLVASILLLSSHGQPLMMRIRKASSQGVCYLPPRSRDVCPQAIQVSVARPMNTSVRRPTGTGCRAHIPLRRWTWAIPDVRDGRPPGKAHVLVPQAPILMRVPELTSRCPFRAASQHVHSSHGRLSMSTRTWRTERARCSTMARLARGPASGNVRGTRRPRRSCWSRVPR